MPYIQSRKSTAHCSPLLIIPHIELSVELPGMFHTNVHNMAPYRSELCHKTTRPPTVQYTSISGKFGWMQI